MTQPISSNASDPRLERDCGIKLRHAAMLLAFCQGTYRRQSLLVVVRGANPKSLKWQNQPGHLPKPYDVKAKTASTGRVIPAGGDTFFYSDYDLFGVYTRQHMGDYTRLYVGNYQPSAGIGTRSLVSPVDNDFLDTLNTYVCRRFGDDDMFQHGTEADYLRDGRPQQALKDDYYAAFEHTGQVFIIPGAQALKQYYRSRRGLTWVWS